MIYPGVGDAFDAVINAIETEIAPHVSDEYATSLCRTAGQMLRSMKVRALEQIPALAGDNDELRAMLTDHVAGLEPAVAVEVRSAIDNKPEIRYAGLDELIEDALRLRAALSSVIESIPAALHPTRIAGREYMEHQMQRELPWMQKAFTGARR